MQLFCSPTDLESVDGTTVLGKLDWTSQYNDPSISSSYHGFHTLFSILNSESSGHAGTVMGLVIFLQCLQVNMIFEMLEQQC